MKFQLRIKLVFGMSVTIVRLICMFVSIANFMMSRLTMSAMNHQRIALLIKSGPIFVNILLLLMVQMLKVCRIQQVILRKNWKNFLRNDWDQASANGALPLCENSVGMYSLK